MMPVTDERKWLSGLENTPEWRPPARPTVIVAPHPDDETLGAGGLIAYQTSRGIPVTVIAVTDGEAAYGDSTTLAGIRRLEQEAALAELNVPSGNIIRLGLPDSNVTPNSGSLLSLLSGHIGSDALLVAPWPSDPHPDHEACGIAAVAIAKQKHIPLIFYLFWTWHRNTPDSISGSPLFRLPLDQSQQQARARALNHHRSQLYRETGDPVLPPVLLAPAQRAFETFIIHD